jgi:hypothetical protein
MTNGWTNWADVIQGAKFNQDSSFIQTWKCKKENAKNNVIAMEEYRKDVCVNGDRRWIFAGDDNDQYVIIDLGKTRLVSEMGVEFGDAVERLPSAITFKYLGEETSVVTPQSFSTFGKVTSNIEEYVSAVWFGSVQARYVLYQFQEDEFEGGTAFLQLVAAGPDLADAPSTGYVVIVIMILAGLIGVGACLYVLSQLPMIRKRFSRQTKSQIARENAEFSSDSDTDSDDSGDSSSDSSGSSDKV